MPPNPHRIEPLLHPVEPDDLDDLAALLVDAVESGAAVSFLLPLSHAAARQWWVRTLESLHAKAVVLVAREVAAGAAGVQPRARIIGTVQIQPAWAPNQPHRAEVCKMIVHRRARGRGLGRALMHAIEAAARGQGFTLLTLDAKRGGPAESLYRAMGWTYVGMIPRFALDPDGKGMHDDVLFYKELGGER